MSTPAPVASIGTWIGGLGRILAIIGLVIVIVLLVVGRMAFVPEGLLFGLAFLAILL